MEYSLNQITFDVIETYRENYKDTDALDIRRVRSWVDNTRAVLLKRKLERSIFNIGQVFNQTLPAVALEQIDVSSTPSTYSFGDIILATTIDIPRGIETPDELEAITRISTMNITEARFKFIHLNMLPYEGNGRYDYSTIYVFRIGNKLGFWSKDDAYQALSAVDITGIWQDPVAAARIADATYSFDDEYPMSQSMAEDVKKMIYKDYLRITINPPVDKTEDNEHNLTKD